MRNVRIGTTSFLVDDLPHTVEQNRERATGYIRSASERGCDVILLPEMVATVNVPSGEITPEPTDGPTLERFAREARECGVNVIGTWYCEEEGRIYNQTTLIDRRGDVVGRYRKVQPTAREAERVTSGNELPVFDLDFGRVAVMICLEIYFPEIPRIYAHKGAEILFWPTVTLGPTQEGLLAQATSRAIDNGLVIVESNLAVEQPYAPYIGRSRPATARIIDSAGDILAATGRRHGVAVADIDLDETRLTSTCVLIREPDHFREDMESITRLDLYAREYTALHDNQARHTPYWKNIND